MGSCAAPSAKGDDKFITTDYLQQCHNKHATTGPGETQFARAMRCLNITPLCAETSQAKGRVERAHLTLQDRLVKELRLKGICTIEAANAFAEGL